MTYEYYAEVNIDEEIYCNSVKNFGKDFEIFTTNVNGRKKIAGFKFKFTHNDKIDINYNSDFFFLYRHVLHYLDFFTSITSYPVNKSYFSTIIFNMSDERLLTINLSDLIPPKSDDVEIDLTNYQNTLSNLTTNKIENFRYYYAGVVFFDNRLYEFSIREFKIIELDRTVTGYKEYKIIRDLFSHNNENLPNASDKFLKSNLKTKFLSEESFNQNGEKIVIIDRYHPNNVLELIRMAKDLREVVKPRILN